MSQGGISVNESRANGQRGPAPGANGSEAGHVFGRAVRGVFWSYVSFAGSKLLAFISTVILARLLLPTEFGQIGFALIVVGYLDIAGDLGVGAALIYEQKRTREAANIAFVISLMAGVFWFCLAFALAPLAAAFFRDPLVEPLLRTLAVVFILTALGSTHDWLLRKELAFKQRLIPDFIRAAVKGIAAVMLALFGWGVWSLVWGQLIGAAIATIVLWRLVPWRPQFRLEWDLARRMVRYGSHIVSVNILAAVTHHIDFLIVGRMLGSAALGFYTIAYRIPEMVIAILIWIVGHVSFPTYSKLQHDHAALRQAFLATQRYLSLMTIPAGLALAALAPLIVPTAFGPNWNPSVPVLQALALAISLRSLGSNAGDVYKATGRTRILMTLGIVRAVVLIPTLIYGARFGIAGVALAQVVVIGASALLNLYVASRILDIPLNAILIQFRPAVLSSIVMLAGLYGLLQLMAGWPALASLLITMGLGLGIYVLATWVFSRDTVERAWTMILTSFGRVT